MINPSLEKIGIVGAGGWGTALSLLLAGKGHRVDLWVFEEDLCATMQQDRENPLYLPGFRLPEGIRPSKSLQEVVAGKKVLLLVVPTHVLRNTLKALKRFLDPDCLVINASKGIENETLLPIHKIIQESISNPLAVLSGPTFAKEIAQGKPSAIVAAASQQETAERVQSLFNTEKLKVFTSTDLMGVELGGSLKNVIAIAVGVASGLGLGYNPAAALMTRGLAEISRLAEAMGGRRETLAGLSGVGDLVLTCTGQLSRNRTVGVALGEGKSLADIVSKMRQVAEGVATTHAAVALARAHQIEMPIALQMERLLRGEATAREAMHELLDRPVGSE